MHYILFAELPGFYVREWELRDPERASAPLAVHREKRVIDLNDHAREAGLRHGMGIDEAKVLLQGTGLILYEEEPYRNSQQRWLDVLCEFSSTVEPFQQDSSWADLSSHPDPLDIAQRIRESLSNQISLTPRMGMAGTKWLAQLCADVIGDVQAKHWEPTVRQAIQRPECFLKQLPTSALTPICHQHRDRLKFLGYRSIGDVAEIPLRTLRGQFGDDAHRIRSAARGGCFEAVRPLYPPDSVSERMTFEGGLSDSTELLRALERIAQRLAKALSERESQAATVVVRIALEEGSLERSRTFSSPIRTARQAFSALSRLVGTPEAPVHFLEVRLPSLKKAQERQSDLFAARTPGDDAAVERAVGRVRQVFGDGSVIHASEKYEPRRVRVLRAWSHATGWK